MGLAFQPGDLVEMGALAPADSAGLELSLQNPIHPFFAFSNFNRPMPETLENVHIQYCPEDAWWRMHPALVLASRLITSPRYSHFWHSLIRDEAPLYDERGNWMVRLLSHPLSSRELSDIFDFFIGDRLKGISFAAGLRAHGMSCVWRTSCDAHSYIIISTNTFASYLTSAKWDSYTMTQRLVLHFRLARMLTHELAHVFTLSLFGREPMMLGGDMFRMGQPEIGTSWERYFMLNGGLNGHLEPSVNDDQSRVGKWGMCLLDWGFAERSLMERTLMVACGSGRREVVAVPISIIERLFQEEWFTEPYPQWNVDLTHAPRAYEVCVWGERKAVSRAASYRELACTIIKDSGDSKRRIQLLRIMLESILGVQLDKKSYRNWLDPRQDLTKRTVRRYLKGR